MIRLPQIILIYTVSSFQFPVSSFHNKRIFTRKSEAMAHKTMDQIFAENVHVVILVRPFMVYPQWN